jgi:hypothetical protein
MTLRMAETILCDRTNAHRQRLAIAMQRQDDRPDKAKAATA